MTIAIDDFDSLAAGELLAGNWTQVNTVSGGSMRRGSAGPAQVATNAVYTISYVLRNDITPTNDQYSQIEHLDISQGASFGYLLVRASGADTTLDSYQFRWRVANANSAAIYKIVNGSESIIAGPFTHASVQSGDEFRVEAIGTTISAYLNDTLLGAVTDSTYSSGDVGFGLRTEDSFTFGQLDNWEGGDLGVSGLVLTLPTTTSITDTTVTVGCTTDDATGTQYYYISTSGTAPSESDLKAGTGAGHVDSGSNSSLSVGITTYNVTGLTASTTYYTYFIQNDGTDDSNILESGSWATLAAQNAGVSTQLYDKSGVFLANGTTVKYILAPTWDNLKAGTSLTFNDTATITLGNGSLVIDSDSIGSIGSTTVMVVDVAGETAVHLAVGIIDLDA